MNQMSFAEHTEKKPMSFAKIIKASKTYTTKPASNKISFGVTKAGSYERASVTIGEFYMEELGWMIKDRVDMLYFPEDQLVIVKRVGVHEPGFSISGAYKNTNRGTFGFVWKKPVPYHRGAVEMEAVEVRKDPQTGQKCLYFTIPKIFEFFNGEK